MGESFIQWVIEDDFEQAARAWNGRCRDGAVGQAHEEAKIRLLNATQLHCLVEHAGWLPVHPRRHARRRHSPDGLRLRHDDAIPVLHTPEQPCPIDLEAYRDVVLDRFGNPAIADTNQRVAMDAFSKIPGMIAPTIRDKLARQASFDSVALLPALFLAYLQRWHAGQIPTPTRTRPWTCRGACHAAPPTR